MRDKRVWGVHMRANVFFSKDYKRYLSIFQDNVEFSDLLCIFADFQTLCSSRRSKREKKKGGTKQLSTLCWFTANAQACLTMTFELLWHWQLKGFRRQPRLAALALSRASSSLCCSWQTAPLQSQTNDFDLPSAVQVRSYWYNPPNDVKDLSAKLMNDKNIPSPCTSLPPPSSSLKTPQLQAKKIESQDTLLISPSPCLLALTFLNRSSSYKGQCCSFCVLKCG